MWASHASAVDVTRQRSEVEEPLPGLFPEDLWSVAESHQGSPLVIGVDVFWRPPDRHPFQIIDDPYLAEREAVAGEYGEGPARGLQACNRIICQQCWERITNEGASEHRGRPINLALVQTADGHFGRLQFHPLRTSASHDDGLRVGRLPSILPRCVKEAGSCSLSLMAM